MLPLEDALSRILTAIQPLGPESIAVTEAHGRVCAEDFSAALDLPAFDNSAMDGYAVRAEDVAKASAASPAELRVVGKVAAGEMFRRQVGPGECVRLFTGSVLPADCNAVVMQEDTRTAANDDSSIQVLEGVKPWENIRLQGEDVRRGTKLLEAGALLTVGKISLLAAQGVARIRVGRQPIVGLLATGNELREPGQPLAPGQIYESNRVGLVALIRAAGGRPQPYALVGDTLAATKAALEKAFAECDVVVSSGGVSVGEFDFVKKAFAEIGGSLEFWRVAIRPGKPFVFGRRDNKFLFGVPGNPVSALVTFQLLVRPALLKLQGAAEVGSRIRHGIVAEPLANHGDRRHFMRVRVNADGRVWSAGTQSSHCLESLSQADGLLDVPPRTILSTESAARIIELE